MVEDDAVARAFAGKFEEDLPFSIGIDLADGSLPRKVNRVDVSVSIAWWPFDPFCENSFFCEGGGPEKQGSALGCVTRLSHVQACHKSQGDHRIAMGSHPGSVPLGGPGARNFARGFDFASKPDVETDSVCAMALPIA
jgi:hypothetical protein